MPEINMNDVVESVKDLRAEFEKSAPDHDKIERIEKGLEAFEAKSQEFVTSQKAAEQKSLEIEEKAAGLEDQVKSLEVEIARGISNGDKKDYRDSAEYKSLVTFVKTGGFIDAEQKAQETLRTDIDVSGGYLVPSEMDNMITKKITEISAVRAVSRVRTIGAKSLEVAIRSSIPTATYEGEAAQGNDSTSHYSLETLTAYRQTATSPATMDMLINSAFDMESEITSDITESFAFGEGASFVNGDGVKKPNGFLQDNRITGLTSSTSGTIDADDIILISGELKTGYSPTYMFNRRTLAFIRTLKATDGNFLWQPGLNGVVANTINGSPYLIADDMPDIASNSKSVVFGDFMRGYTIVDRTGISVVRDEFTLKKQGIIEFTFNRWNTGQVVLPEAIKILTTQA